MRLRGSVLIVVLGLLAVLAVIGVAFVTMSSIESNSAFNYAVQAEFDLAADGAVDYVAQALIRDIWEFGTLSTETATYRQYTGYMLTGKFGTWPWDWPDVPKPGAGSPATPAENPINPWPDAFLATNWMTNAAPMNPNYSFRTTETLPLTSPSPYNLQTWRGDSNNLPFAGNATTDGSPNNLGIPLTGSTVYWYDPPNGFWLPELSSPFQGGVIRVSVTVQDHAAMVNFNAHGAPVLGAADSWAYKKAAGKGYFVCDLAPDITNFPGVFTGTSMDRLLLNSGKPPGRYSATTNAPGNPRLGEVFLQNPAIAQDRPFTLDDEFELRRLTGTYAQSRLEQISVAGGGANLDSAPSGTNQPNPTKIANRLALTTVGWTADVMPGRYAMGGADVRKCDLNLAWDQGGTSTLGVPTFNLGGVMPQSTNQNRLTQFVANILAFKERRVQTGTSQNYFELQPYTALAKGARRQVIITKVKVDKRQSNTPSAGKDTFNVTVQLYAPWRGNYAGDPSNSMDVTNHRIKVYGGTSDPYELNGKITSIPGRTPWYTSTPISVTGSSTFNISKVTLEADGVPGGIIDQITSATSELGTTYPVTKRRVIGVYDEPRAADEDASCVATVLYVKNWTTGADSNWTALEGGTTGVASGAGIPIRFPHSVPYYSSTDPNNKWDTSIDGPLPPYSSAADTKAKIGIFKAFLRVGDLNQVLCPTEADATGYWPWITKVAAQSTLITSTGTGPPTTADIAAEALVKWDWWPAAAAPNEVKVIDRTIPVYVYTTTGTIDTTKTQYRRFNAGNIFCVDSPWADSFDNDGDGVADAKDTAVDKANGRFCGKEIRVAGRINLNTAVDKTLNALGRCVTGLDATYTSYVKSNRPFTSPVEVLRYFTAYSTKTDCKGPLEKRDFWYTSISNIASVRSDTFSIYGTVQYVIPPPWNKPATKSLTGDGSIRIVRTRRFWALVDRSPCFSSPPSSVSNFVRPRVLNFQWMD